MTIIQYGLRKKDAEKLLGIILATTSGKGETGVWRDYSLKDWSNDMWLVNSKEQAETARLWSTVARPSGVPIYTTLDTPACEYDPDDLEVVEVVMTITEVRTL